MNELRKWDFWSAKVLNTDYYPNYWLTFWLIRKIKKA